MQFHRSMFIPLVALTSLTLAATACGGASDSSPAETSEVPAASVSAPTEPVSDTSASQPAESAASDGGSAVPVAPPIAGPSDLTPICDTIPSLDAIGAILGGRMLSVEDLSTSVPTPDGVQAIISDKCEATGDPSEVRIADFQRLDAVTGAGVIALAQEQGLVFDRSWPELPGAVAWSNTVTIERDGLYYSTFGLTIDVAGVADSPEAYDMAAALLTAWLNG